MRRGTIYVFLCLGLLQVWPAQTDSERFLSAFKKAGDRKKVELVASGKYEDLKAIYPHIKDTLAEIRRRIYRSPADARELKFLFDKIEADIALYNKNYGKATLILENAIQSHATSINDTLRCLTMLKDAFVRMRNVNRAFEIQYLIESRWHRKSDSVDIDYGVPKSALYGMLGLKTEAITERRKEFNNRADKKDTDAVVAFYNDMGFYFNKKKNSDSAEFYFIKAKELLLKKRVPKGKETYYDFYKGLIDGNLAVSLYNRGNIKGALPLLQKDIYYSLKGEYYESAFNSYIQLAQCYMQIKDKGLARRALDTAQSLLDDRLKGVNFKLKLLPVVAEYYNMANEPAKAAGIYKTYFAMNDSFLSLEKEKDVINQEIMFSIEQREFERIEKEKMARQLQLDDARDSSYIAYLLAGFLLLCMVILFMAINNRSTRQRESQLFEKNKQIQEQKTQIEQSLKEKEALIKEIHHRVKNNLQIVISMLNLQMGKADDEKTSAILFEAKQRINAIALTHQMLYQKITISNIAISEYLETLVRQIEATMNTPLVELVMDVPRTDSRLTIDGAVPLGLIVNELLTNAYKHAFPRGKEGTITVSLKEHPTHFTVSVSDTGIGLGENFTLEENKTLGMELVHILVEQLESQLIIETGKGTTFTFDIKKAQLK